MTLIGCDTIELVIGTAQFGMEYGITNSASRPTSNEINEILEYAYSENINVLDSAPAYGNSEKLLGECSASGKFSIMTKTINLNKEHNVEKNLEQLEKGFQNSLKDLRLDTLEGLFVHNALDLLKEDGYEYYKLFQKLKEEHYVNKVGVSVYEQFEIESILSRFDVDMIQLPINVFDQRLETQGVLKCLKARNIEIYARSIFLQGLLLCDEFSIPLKFKNQYSYYERYFKTLKQNGMNKLEGALKYIYDLKEIDYAIVGINSLEQLKELVRAYRNIETVESKIDYSLYACSDQKMIDPRRW